MISLLVTVIYRHRFSGFVLSPAETPEERARHLELCRIAGGCALAIVADHLHIVSVLMPAPACLRAPADRWALALLVVFSRSVVS